MNSSIFAGTAVKVCIRSNNSSSLNSNHDINRPLDNIYFGNDCRFWVADGVVGSTVPLASIVAWVICLLTLDSEFITSFLIILFIFFVFIILIILLIFFIIFRLFFDFNNCCFWFQFQFEKIGTYNYVWHLKSDQVGVYSIFC